MWAAYSLDICLDKKWRYKRWVRTASVNDDAGEWSGADRRGCPALEEL